MRRPVIALITTLAVFGSMLAIASLSPAGAATNRHEQFRVGDVQVRIDGAKGSIATTNAGFRVGPDIKVTLRERDTTLIKVVYSGTTSNKLVLWHPAGTDAAVSKSGGVFTIAVTKGAGGATTTTTTAPTSSPKTTTTTTTSPSSSPAGTGFGKPVPYVTPEKSAALKRHQIGFSVDCGFSHSAKNDPIVYPGQSGKSHLHDFFGSVVTDAYTKAADLQGTKTTCTSRDDQTAYWFPAVWFNGNKVTAKTTTFYYKPGVYDRKSIEPIPLGLQMIAGNGGATGPQDPQYFWWQEFGNASNNTSSGKMITSSSGKVTLKIVFPDCWDGKRLSADNQAHMKYHTNKRTCPSSHPVPIPQVTTYVTYPIKGGAGLTLASGKWFTMHADFFNAWHPVTQQKLIDECIVPKVRCGNVYDFDSRKIPG